MSAKPINVELARSLFEYRDGKLYWRGRGRCPRRSIGKEAGALKHNGRRHVWFDGARYLVHRIIWAMHHGDPGDLQVDHIDRNPLNNKIENLRLATNSENQRNSNAKGVYFCNTHKHWRAHIYAGGKRIHLGSFKTEAEALEARRQAEPVYYGAFAPRRAA